MSSKTDEVRPERNIVKIMSPVTGRQDYMILHVDLLVRSMDVSVEFYRDKLGFSVVEDTTLNGPIVRSISRGSHDAMRLVLLQVSGVGAMIELMQFQPESALMHPAPRPATQSGWLTLLVPDLRTHVDQLLIHGIYPESDIFTVKLPGSQACSAVFYRDPDGNRLEFLEVQC